MRSRPENPNKGKTALVLTILALIWLVAGTLFMLKIKDVIVNGTYSSGTVQEETQQEETSDPDSTGDEDPDDQNDTDQDDSWDDDLTDNDVDEDDEDLYDDNDQDDDKDGADEDDEADDEDHDADDEDDGVETFTVDAWDGFAAVRTGRGTSYSQVGRLNNGETVKVTDLDDGWYKIASGKWKGYYLHKSSLK